MVSNAVICHNAHKKRPYYLHTTTESSNYTGRCEDKKEHNTSSLYTVVPVILLQFDFDLSAVLWRSTAHSR
jgi:hypothetical protein